MSEDQKKRLEELCNQKIAELGLGQEYKIRLRNELREVDVQDAYGYFLELHDEGFRSPNENNLVIPYLLGICSEFDINQESAHTIGEFPDIDTDFLPEIRDYLKYEWAPQKFGEDFVAQIGSYNTYKMKMALLDMARIFNQDRNEILKITKNFDSKDDEGEALTWETALELYPNFKEYCEKHPELTDAARRLTGRIRSAGKHASGLMISSTPIKDIVPLMGDDYELTTAWTEGQASSELSAVGLVKFDLLGLKTLQQIVDTMSLIYKRHGIDKLCALPGQPSWSDQSYLDDPELMKMASEGDMTLAFQFGAHGIRHLVKKGKADSFKDIYAYASLYRPGPIGMGMHNVYCDRKNGEPYTVHEKLKFLEKTYGVLAFQEQVMRVLNIAGGIPLRDCEAVRKAMSKKKIEKFIKYKEMFIKNSQINLGITEEEADNLWQTIEKFSGYGFNSSHAVAYSVLTMRQMYLKKYFPIEFYTSSLNNVSSRYSGTERDEQLRNAKRITEDHDIRVKPVDINKSSTDFSIVDEQIYTGFSVIKGIGHEAAERIVNTRPYESFDDFLDKFGYESKTVQPILALRMFKEADPVRLYKYFQYRKTKDKKYQESSKRSEASSKKNRLALDNFAALVDYKPPLEFYTDDDIEIMASFLPPGEQKLLRRTYASAIRSQLNYKVKLRDYKAPCLADFTDEQAAEIEIPKELEELLSQPEKAEQHYYGFCWTHPLDKCPRAKDYTFENHNINAYKVGPVEGLIIDVKERQGKVKYHIITLQDKNWNEEGITVWDNDFKRFKEDLVAGNLVRLQVKPPDEGYTRYTLFSYPPWKPHLIPKKEADFRVVRLKTRSEMTESELEDTLIEHE